MAQKLLRAKKSKIAPKKDASADVGVGIASPQSLSAFRPRMSSSQRIQHTRN